MYVIIKCGVSIDKWMQLKNVMLHKVIVTAREDSAREDSAREDFAREDSARENSTPNEMSHNMSHIA
jgi:hypothetical protein